MKSWEELEQEPEYGLLAPEERVALHDEWRNNLLGSLADEDPEAVDSVGVNRFVATERARNQALKTGKPFDPTTAEKEYVREVEERTAAQKQALTDYDELEKARFALKDVSAVRGVTSAEDRGRPIDPRVAEILDRDKQETQRKIDEISSRFTPEMLEQVKAAREATEGKRPTAVLGSDLYTDPSLLLDKDSYRSAVAESEASPEAKAKAMAGFAAKRKQFAEEALRTLRIAGESPIPGAQDFPSWESSQPEAVRRLSPEDKALQYMREMQKRGDIRKLTSAISTGLLQGGTDIASQGMGVAAMISNSGDLAEKAAEVAEGAQTLEEVSKLEGDKQATGATTLGGAARLLPPMAATIAPAALTGGAGLGISASLAGAQTAGAQFPNTYTALRKQGMSEQDALNASRNSAIASGIITAGLTAAFGRTGMEAALGAGAGGKELVKSRLVAAMKSVPKGAAAEIPEELLDEAASQVIEQRTIDPEKPVSQIIDEFAETAPDLAMQIALLGGAGGAVGGYRGSTTQEAQPAPADDFAQRAAMEGATEYRAPEVKVNGVTIATINPESGWTPEDVLDFADSPDDMATLARNKIITLPEVVAPIEGVDPAITDEMNERLAASAAIAPQTVEALKAAPAPAPEVQTETAEPIETEGAGAAEVPVTETTEEVKPAETLGVTPPPAPALEAPEGAARNADMLRQAAARAAGTEQGPRIGFLSTAVTAETETPSSTANAAGGSQSVQTEPAEGSIPAVTEDTVSISDIPSTAEIPVTPQGEAPTTATEGQSMPGGSSEWSPTVGQPATATINGQKIVGTVGASTGKGLVSFQYEWNGKTQKATVRPDRLESPVASLTDPPKYQYTQEQNSRKAGKHFPIDLGVHANHDFRKSFASMAEDTSLSRIYRQIAKVLSTMPAFADVDFHVVADGRKNYAGEYSFSDGKASIAVNLRQVGRGKVDALGTILHEALHHVTLAKVRDPQGTWENDVVSKLDTIRERVAEYAKKKGLAKQTGYELGTNEEFITAIFTRPDFQNFLASIPDSFAPGVPVGRFRSVLSEIFRLIAELVTGEMVSKGSTMEQAMTTVLALFETPFRAIETGRLEALNAAQSKPGYRTPADMLAEAAEKVKGERAAEKPQGLASMFKPQAKRPATGERKLLDMPVRNVMADAYREAVRGSGTQMAPLSTVYAQARLLQPGLTPEAFLAQVQEGYDSGTLLLEGAGSQQEAEQAGLALPGTPVGTAIRMMPAPETPKSLVDEETDAAYLAAVEAGDMETAQRMVDEAAKAAMPDSVVHESMFSSKERRQDKPLLKVYHGTDQEFNIFESGRPTADDWGFFGAIETNRHGNFFAENKTFAETYAKARQGKRVITAFLNIKNPFQFTDAQDILESRDLGEEMTADFHMARWLMSLRHQWEAFDGREGVDFTNWLREKGYDGAFIQEDGHGLVDAEETQDVWVALDPNQIKSADPVTRDESGNVIPLSQRFNPESPSTLYSLAEEGGEPPTIDIGGEAEPADGPEFAFTRARFAPPKPEDQMYQVQSDEEATKKAFAWINAVGPLRAADLLMADRAPSDMDLNVKNIVMGGLLKGFTEISIDPNASEDEKTVARATNQRLGKYRVRMNQDAARGMRQIGVQNGAVLQPIAPVLAAEEVLADRGEKILKGQIEGGSEGAAPRVAAAADAATAEADERLKNIIRRLKDAKRKLLDEDSKALEKLVNSIRNKILPDSDWSDILYDLPRAQAERLAAIKDRVAKHEALQNLTPDESEKLADSIDRLWQRERLKAFQDELFKAGVLKAKTTKAIANVASAAPELLRLMNLGVFNSSTFREAVAKKFGLKLMTNEQANFLRKLAVEAWEQPRGVLRNKKLKQLVEGLQHVTGSNWADAMNSYWTASVLSGLRTHFDTWGAVVNGLGTNLIQAGLQLSKGKGVAAFDIQAQWWKGLFTGLNEALYLLRTGDPSFTKHFEADLIDALDGEKTAYPIAIGEKMWKSGNLLQKIPGALMMVVGRSMVAADHINNTATTQGAMAVARAMNPELYEGKTSWTQKEIADARKQAIAETTGGVEPESREEALTVNKRTREILNAGLTEADQMAASEVGDIASFQNDPTGLFGGLYHAVKSGLSSAVRSLDQVAQDEEAAKITRAFAAVTAGSVHALTGTRFMRFGFNLGNEFMRYMPGSWLLNKGTNILGRKLSPMQQEMLIGKNVVGGILLATLYSLFGDDDESEDGKWHMEGPWNDLSLDEQASRLSAGMAKNSFWRRKDGKIERISYSQWPTAGLLAAVGSMLDEKRYKPEDWNQRGVAGHILQGAVTGLFQVQNAAAMQQVAELFSTSSSYGAAQGMPEKVIKMGTNYLGGLVPTAVKDLDKWQDPRNFRADGAWEKLVREMPVARRFVNDGRPQFNRIGQEVRLHREPYSRLYTADEADKATVAYGQLLARGIDFPTPSTSRQIIKGGKKVPMDTLGKGVTYDFEKAVAIGYGKFLQEHGEKITTMPLKALDKLIRDRATRILDIETRKVQAKVNNP